MDQFYSTLTAVHILFGTISLVLFWIPLFAKKGKNLHNQIGRWYVVFMSMVVLTALMMCADLIFRQHSNFGYGLGLLALLTFQPLLQGYCLAKYKTVGPKLLITMKIMGILILLMSVVNLYMGLTQNTFLLVVFATIGLSAGTAITKGYFQLKEYNHIALHLSGMLISGGAAYTAFLAFGASRFMPEWFTSSYWVILPWTLPTFASIIAARIWEKKYPVKVRSKK